MLATFDVLTGVSLTYLEFRFIMFMSLSLNERLILQVSQNGRGTQDN